SRVSAADIRRKFLEYFSTRDHKLIASSPVIPFDDPTLLFTNAGMNQFKRVFTGDERAPHPRAASSQKCMRAGGKHNDLENVGFTTRHHTFFEMLGNFSFGDYFKEQAIVYAWELLTKEFGLDPERLYATVYEEDDEAFDLWAKVAPELKDKRLLRFGKKDNFWAMGDVGPCGPCSEIHYDRGERFGKISKTNTINSESERFVEIWNLVFMQYNQPGAGQEMEPLPKGSVDTGAGLERWACILQEVDSNYDIDLFRSIIQAIEEVTGAKYNSGPSGASHRVIADHLRALCFSIADGGGISNEKQGYVLRRILRLAARHGRELGATEPFIHRLAPALVNEMGAVYPELIEKQDHIRRVIEAEEESFGRTLDAGLKLFENEVAILEKTGTKVIPGEIVFKLYDTHGFPADLTEVMARERGMTIDEAGFEAEMAKQRARGRESFAFGVSVEYSGAPDAKDLAGLKPTTFVRNAFEVSATILKTTSVGERITVVLDKTPFYIESGGQVSDLGNITASSFEIDVFAMQVIGGYYVHWGKFARRAETMNLHGVEVTARVDVSRRKSIMRNHTATHLMHAALRQTLGEHVKQAGSLVSDEKLRFDFSHFEALTKEQVSEVEQAVNAEILKATEVTTEVMSLEEAQKTGAMALFGEKYSDKVRVVSVGDFSKELCGGTHVGNTAEIGLFMITLEGGIASGVRRIEAITGEAAIAKALQLKTTFAEVGRSLKSSEEHLAETINKLSEDYKRLQKEHKKLKAERFSTGAASVGQNEIIGAITFYTHDFGAIDRDEITGWADGFKNSAEASVAAGVGAVNGKVTLVTSASPGAVAAGVHIGNAAKRLFEQFGSRGGGRENFAQGAAPVGVSADDLFTAFKQILIETTGG
ncbi:MAG: alanine--tRNA ligase, partial [Candidatus Zixiibacteriota bacterium]